MGILKTAINEQAFLKIGIFGSAGSGKTTTASYLAMGITHNFDLKKPVAFFETEAGSDFLVDRFAKEGIELLRVKSHAIQDLMQATIEAEKECGVLIVDSITHVWNEVLAAKLNAVNEGRAKKRLYKIDKLEFQHYSDIKAVWAKWTTLFLNTKLNIIVCGRSGNIWEYETNEESGRKELQRGGTKMKAETEFGYEPSLLIEMERVSKGEKPGSGWRHRACILKDRSDTINGRLFEFEKPSKTYAKGDWKSTFKAFQPAIMCLNPAAEHVTFDASRTAQDLFSSPDGDSPMVERAKKVTIALEEIQGTLTALWPGQDAASKKYKQTVIEALFKTRSWTAVEGQSLETLEIALLKLRQLEDGIKTFEGQSPEELLELINTYSLETSN